MRKLTLWRSVLASSGDKGAWEGETGEHSSCERERTEALGIRILCSVLWGPNTLSPNWLAISAGYGSRAPKSPRKSCARLFRATVNPPSLRWVGEKPKNWTVVQGGSWRRNETEIWHGGDDVVVAIVRLFCSVWRKDKSFRIEFQTSRWV